MKKLIALVTFFAGLPGLAGIYLLIKLSKIPPGAELVIVNAILFRGICGTIGGVLLWLGRRIGYYLTLIMWFYLIVVSVLTLSSLYHKGIDLSSAFHSDQVAAFGRPFAWSIAKLIIGIPVFYILIRDLGVGKKPAV